MTTLVDFGGNTLITENIRVGATTSGQAGTDLSSTELTRLDGVTAGTVTASKAVVVDANKDIATFRHITLSGNLVTGTTTLSEAELGTVDGVTAGTVAASKAVIVDANKDATGFRNVSQTGSHTTRSATANPATAASAVSALTFGSSGLGLYWGDGSPSTALTAPKGSLYICTNASSGTTRMYVNTDSSTAWTAFNTVG